MNRVYKTMQGKEIDMDALMARNETMPAVGNVRVNARGDELGPDGKIVRTREEVLSEYYDSAVSSTFDEDALTQKVKIQSERTEFGIPARPVQPTIVAKPPVAETMEDLVQQDPKQKKEVK